MEKGVISKFKERPKTKTAWRAAWFGLVTLLIPPMLDIFAAVIRPIIDRVSSENTGAAIGFASGIAALILSISAIAACVNAFKKGERSWFLWAGFIPAVLTGVFWVFVIVGEFIFPH
jgi:hypothetical protein